MLLRQRIGTKLEVQHLAGSSLPRLRMERSTSRLGRPQTFPLPARARVVDAAIHSLGEEADGIRHAQHYPLAVLEREQCILAVARRDGRVLAQAKSIELIHPIV